MNPRRHLLVAAVVAILLPAISWFDGSGLLAFRMYSRTGIYRVRVTNLDKTGERTPVAPTALAALTEGAVRPFLAGADRWTSFPRGEFLAAHLPALAALACRHRSRANTVEVLPEIVEVLVERKRTLDGPVTTNTLRTTCR